MADEQNEVQAATPTGNEAINTAWDSTFDTPDVPLPVDPVVEPVVDTTPAEPVVEGEVVEEATPTETVEASAVDESLQALAIELGADKAALDELVTSDPEEANRLLGALADQYNAQTSRLLFGQPEGLPTGEPSPTDTIADTSPGTPVASPLEAVFADEAKAAAFKEEHGDLLFDAFKAQVDQTKAMREQLVELEQVRQGMAAQQQEVALQELHSTFDSFGPAYADFYGPTSGERTDEQSENRGRVGDLADRIRSGDIRLGNKVGSDRDYLIKAHHHVASDIRQMAIRKQIISEIQTRSKRIISKPSAGRTTNLAAGRSDEAALAALDKAVTEGGLEGLFND